MKATDLVILIKTDNETYHQVALKENQSKFLLGYVQAAFDDGIIKAFEEAWPIGLKHKKEEPTVVNIELYTDGGCLNNGSANQQAYGSYLVYINGNKFTGDSRFDLGNISNNEAEYRSMIIGLNLVKNMEDYIHKITVVTAFTDSELLVKQVTGQWKCKKPHLLPLVYQLRELIEELNVSLQWVPREKIVEVLGH